MAATKKTPAAKTSPAEGTRRCIGSAKFGIEAHDAPVEDFPLQPSQPGGYGRMCKPHWTEYTRSLRRASTPPKAAPAAVAEVERAHADKAHTKVRKTTKAESKGKPVPTVKRVAKPGTGGAGKPSHRPVEHDATLSVASTAAPDAAEQDALVERRQRVKAWRKGELEGTAVKA